MLKQHNSNERSRLEKPLQPGGDDHDPGEHSEDEHLWLENKVQRHGKTEHGQQDVRAAEHLKYQPFTEAGTGSSAEQPGSTAASRAQELEARCVQLEAEHKDSRVRLESEVEQHREARSRVQKLELWCEELQKQVEEHGKKTGQAREAEARCVQLEAERSDLRARLEHEVQQHGETRSRATILYQQRLEAEKELHIRLEKEVQQHREAQIQAEHWEQRCLELEKDVQKPTLSLRKNHAQNSIVVIMKEPKFQTIVVSAAGGSIILGTAGGAFGLTSGMFVGGVVGVVPALLTFGLSIPAGAALGGGTGLSVGTVVGTGVGAASGGITGCIVYKYRAQITNGYLTVKTKALCTAEGASPRTVDGVKLMKTSTHSVITSASSSVIAKYESVRESAIWGTHLIMMKAENFKSNIAMQTGKLRSDTHEIITAPKFKAIAGSAAGGAVVGGTTGGATGTVAGGAMGAAVGVIPALFTVGLSIPVGAAIGGGIGLFAGTATGGSVGAVCGGAVGYNRYKKKCLKDGDDEAHVGTKFFTSKSKTSELDTHSTRSQCGSLVNPKRLIVNWHPDTHDDQLIGS
eukprot:gnl/TRDRNA2_/TRDRNA2_176586_c0_seq3.p1 gnl/TRDRNA2_/TRDRNA2_176586_c0~~gnl/TRDRNA2_/TRDRNA2_176586_c0_seq3.p1  ORF type:complete len:574 (+),score=134.02 gnl/TRDRNA2_/TRDRNA2_176586_c0_seq3:170-1891(+)